LLPLVVNKDVHINFAIFDQYLAIRGKR